MFKGMGIYVVDAEYVSCKDWKVTAFKSFQLLHAYSRYKSVLRFKLC